MMSVILVRDGVLPAGYDESICESLRRTLLVGSDLGSVVDDVARVSRHTWTIELDPLTVPFARMGRILAGQLERIDGLRPSMTAASETILLPASPDGRDLAAHLAMALDRPLHAGAVHVSSDRVTLSRAGGLQLTDIRPPSSFVATLQIGVRGVDPRDDRRDGPHEVIELTQAVPETRDSASRAVQPIDVQPPDASTMDLAEAPRILGGGGGLDDAEAFEQLRRVSRALGASMGVTRVITDRGWVEHDRQIGTTGVVVDPRLYLSFGISGAVQHTSGLGNPDHIISVNTDAHCPMMQMSDIAIVADANEVLDALEILLAESGAVEQ